MLPAGEEEVEEERVRATFRVRVQREAMKGGLSASVWRDGSGERWRDGSSPRKGPGEGRVEGVQLPGKKEDPDGPIQKCSIQCWLTAFRRPYK